MKKIIHYLIISSMIFLGCSENGVFNPTLNKSGFQGITYVDQYGNVGPIDKDDWNFYGCYYPMVDFEMDPDQSNNALSTEGYIINPAWPNPVGSSIKNVIRIPTEKDIKCTFKIFNEDLEEIGSKTEWFNRHHSVFYWDLRKTGVFYRANNKHIKRQGIYRIVYSFNGRIGYGDIWVR